MAPKITEKLFSAIKIMFKGGATLKEVSEYFNVSSATASRIKRAENYTEYKNILAAMWAKKQVKNPAPPIPEVNSLTRYPGGRGNTCKTPSKADQLLLSG